MGNRSVGTRRSEPFRSTTDEALSDASPAREIVRRTLRARRPEARTAPVSGTDGDQFAAVPWTGGVRALRVLPRPPMRSAGKGIDADHRHPGGGSNGPVRGTPGELRLSD